MPRPQRWRDLVPGLLVLAALAVGVYAVVRYARIGALHGDTLQLTVLSNDVGELMAGSEVWLAGQRVGVVSDIRFRPPATDTARRLALTVHVLRRAQPLLRENSSVRLSSGGTLLGAPVLALTVGTPSSPPLGDGDTLIADLPVEPQTIMTRLAASSDDFTELRANVTAVVSDLREGEGTAGAVLRDDFGARAAELGQGFASLGTRVRGSRGTIGAARSRPGDLRSRLGQLNARVDSLRLLLTTDRGAIGRFRRDSTLVPRIAELRNEASILRALTAAPEGTIGRARADAAIPLQLQLLEDELAALIADITHHPLRYLVF